MADIDRIERNTHLLDWLQDGHTHCQHGTKEWCEAYLHNASAVIIAQDVEIARLRGREEEYRKALGFADEQSAKVEALLEPHVRWECASEGCGKPATIRFERGGVGSYYCHDCYMRVQAIPARHTIRGEEP